MEEQIMCNSGWKVWLCSYLRLSSLSVYCLWHQPHAAPAGHNYRSALQAAAPACARDQMLSAEWTRHDQPSQPQQGKRNCCLIIM